MEEKETQSVKAESPESTTGPAGTKSTAAANTTVATTTPATAAANKSPSHPSAALPMDTNITLWQFLFELLQVGEHRTLLEWTSNDGEFKLHDAEAVAKLWGIRKAKPNMNYDKLSRALRYYYDKNIIKKVNGQKFMYRFVGYPDAIGKPSPCNANPSSNAGSPSEVRSNYGQPAMQQQSQQQPGVLQLRNEQQMQQSLTLQQQLRMLNGFSFNAPNPMLPLGGPMMPPTSAAAAAAAELQLRQLGMVGGGTAAAAAAPAASAAGTASSSLASAVHAGMLSGIVSTPSPSDSSACSPNSVGSHSSTSGCSSSAALTPPTRSQLHVATTSSAAAAAGGGASSSTSDVLLSPPGPSSSLSSMENGESSRKRKAPSGGFYDDCEDVKPSLESLAQQPFGGAAGGLLQMQHQQPTSSAAAAAAACYGQMQHQHGMCTYTTASMNNTPNSAGGGGGMASRRTRPEPLNLTGVTAANPADVSATNTGNVDSVMTPSLIPSINGNFYQMVTSLLSASLYGPNSPLAFASPLFGPLPIATKVVAAAAAATAANPAADEKKEGEKNDELQKKLQAEARLPNTAPQVFQFPSMANSPLLNLFSPLGKTPAATSTPIFQFPSSTVASVAASLLSPPSGLTSFAQRYMSDELRTPTATLKTPLPRS